MDGLHIALSPFYEFNFRFFSVNFKISGRLLEASRGLLILWEPKILNSNLVALCSPDLVRFLFGPGKCIVEDSDEKIKQKNICNQ